MASAIAAQAQGVEIKALVYPPCMCGEPFGAHRVGNCSGYVPNGDIENLGTRAYRPSLGLPLTKRVLCGMIWLVERRLQQWRERLGR